MCSNNINNFNNIQKSITDYEALRNTVKIYNPIDFPKNGDEFILPNNGEEFAKKNCWNCGGGGCSRCG